MSLTFLPDLWRPSLARRRTLGLLGIVLLVCTPGLRALGLGDIQVYSAINEPFSAEIGITNLGQVSENELLVALGGVSDYEAAGVRWEFVHSDLGFEVDLSNPGDPLILVSSSRPIQEPYLNFLVQARWPAGRLLREYTVLLDFPVFSGEERQTSTSAPAVRQQPAVATPAPAPRPQPAPAPSRPVAAVPSTSPNAASDNSRMLDPVDGYRVQSGDTLWAISLRVANDLGISRAQAMLAIRDASPEAFIDQNLNQLKAGSVIRMPSRAEATSRSAEQAQQQYAMEMSGALPRVTPVQSAPADFRNAGGAADTDAQFRLASVENTAGAAGGVGQVAEVQAENQRLDDLNAALQEELEAAAIENQDLRERLANLEEQVALMESLIEVQSETGSQVQQAMQQDTAVEPAEPVVTTVTPARVEEQGLLDKVMGLLPVIGLVLVGLLVGAYLIVRKRQAREGAGAEQAYFDDEYDESADVYEESEADAPAQSASYGSEEDFAATMQSLGADADDLDDLEQDEAALDEDEPELSGADGEEDDEWASDFDDLDAFFSGVDDSKVAAPVVSAAAGQRGEEEDEDEISDLDKTVIISAGDFGDADSDEPEQADSSTDLEDDFSIEVEAGAEVDEEPEAESDEEKVDPQSDTENESESDHLVSGLDFDLGGLDDFSDDESLEDEDGDDEANSVEEDDSEQDDDFSLDFDLGDLGKASGDESKEEIASSVTENTSPDDENTLAFETSDLNLDKSSRVEPEASDESDQPELSSESAEDDDLGATLAFESSSSTTDQEPDDKPIDKDSQAEDTDDLADWQTGLDDEMADLNSEQNSEASDEEEDEDEDDLAALELDDLDDLLGDDDADPSEESATEESSPVAEAESEADSSSDTNESRDDDLDDDDFDALLGDLDADLDASLGDGDADTDEECETKLELAEAYIEMGDNAGAAELLGEIEAEGGESYAERVAALRARLDS